MNLRCFEGSGTADKQANKPHNHLTVSDQITTDVRDRLREILGLFEDFDDLVRFVHKYNLTCFRNSLEMDFSMDVRFEERR